MSDYKHIQFTRKGSRANLTLNRPPRNLIDAAMLEELVHAVDTFRDDDSLKVLLVSGANGTFSGGIEPADRHADRIGLLMPNYTRLFDYLNAVRGLVVAAVEGEAMEAGFELALFCDVILAAEDTRFRLTEINMGLFPPIATAILPGQVGRARALDWIISGREIDAQNAHEAGVTVQLSKPGKLREDAEVYVAHIDSLSAPAVIHAKRALDAGLYIPVMDAMRASESTYMLDLMSNIDPHEGIKAAIEGRAPVWRNR